MVNRILTPEDVIESVYKLAKNSKKCATCSQPFTPQRMGQIACSPGCAYQTVQVAKAKKFKAETVRRKRELKDNDKAHWAEKAKKACHAYIRKRDAQLPCISCGTTADVQYCAGHYRPSGVNSALRYDERNIHKQCNKTCNLEKSGNLIAYRKSLIERIGVDVVEWLDNNHEIRRYTIDDLRSIHAYYTAKLKGLQDEH